MKPHVLVVGDLRSMHTKLVQHGARLTLMATGDTLKAKNLHLYERIYAVPPAAALAEWVELARLLHRLDPLSAIGSFPEPFQDRAATIAQALGLPFHSVAVIEHTRQKDRMREVLRAAGVDPTRNQLVETAEDIRAFAAEQGYPVVLKPADGRGSTGVSLIQHPGEIESAISWLREGAKQASILVEQYLAGEEFSIEAMSEGGKHRIICITQKYKEPAHFVEIGHCVPALVEPATEAAIYRFVDQALTALGLQFGPSHTEIIMTDDGPRLVETHTRLGGDQIFELIRLVSGCDLMDLWARQTLGEQVLDELPAALPTDTYAAIWYVTPNAVGTLEHTAGVEAASALPGVMAIKIIPDPGAMLTGLHHSYSRGAYAIAMGQSMQEAVARAQAAAKQLKFVIACQG